MLFHPLYTFLSFNLMVPFMCCWIPLDDLNMRMDFFPIEVIKLFERVSEAEENILIKGVCLQFQRVDLKFPLISRVQTAHNWEPSFQEPDKAFVMQEFFMTQSSPDQTHLASTRSRIHLGPHNAQLLHQQQVDSGLLAQQP